MKEEVNHPVITHKRNFGQYAADSLTKWAGSWTFIIVFIIILLIWTITNSFALVYRWDPYPFIFLNLILSCITAIQVPIILMSQNRQSQKDRLRLEYDYRVNIKAEREIELIKKQLDRIERKLK